MTCSKINLRFDNTKWEYFYVTKNQTDYETDYDSVSINNNDFYSNVQNIGFYITHSETLYLWIYNESNIPYQITLNLGKYEPEYHFNI